MIMGHEASGTVAAVGPAVTSLIVGDRVAIEPGIPCRRCKECISGHYNFCPDLAFAACPGPGPMVHGVLTQFFRSQEEFCYKLPNHVSLDMGVLVEPLAVAVHAAKLLDLRPGQSVIVFGAGTVGLLCAAVARELGAGKTIIVDINDARLDFTRKWAAAKIYKSDVSLSPATNAQKLIEVYGLGAGADAIFEVTGAEPSIQAAIHVARRGASYVQTGIGRSDITIPWVVMSEKEMRVMGHFRYGAGDFALAIDLLRRRRIDVGSLITKRVDFEQAVDAWETTQRGEGIKTLIRVGGNQIE